MFIRPAGPYKNNKSAAFRSCGDAFGYIEEEWYERTALEATSPRFELG